MTNELGKHDFHQKDTATIRGFTISWATHKRGFIENSFLIYISSKNLDILAFFLLIPYRSPMLNLCV